MLSNVKALQINFQSIVPLKILNAIGIMNSLLLLLLFFNTV